MKKFLKFFPLLILLILDILSFFELNFYGSPSTKSIIISTAFIIIYWLTAFIFAGNKKFLIGASIYLGAVLFFFLLILLNNFVYFMPEFLDNISIAILLTFMCPVSPLVEFIVSKLSYGSSTAAYFLFVFVIVSFYLVYFIGKYIKERER